MSSVSAVVSGIWKYVKLGMNINCAPPQEEEVVEAEGTYEPEETSEEDDTTEEPETCTPNRNYPMYRHDSKHTGKVCMEETLPFQLNIARVEVESPQRFSPTVVLDEEGEGIIFYQSDVGVGAVDLESLEELWFFETEGRVYGPPAVDPSTGRVLFGEYHEGGESKIYLVDMDSGDEIYSYSLGNTDVTFSQAVIKDSKGYIGTNLGTLLIFDLNADSSESGLVGSIELDSSIYSSPAVDEEGNIYVTTRWGGLYSISPSLEINWFFELPEGITTYSSPSLEENLGLVYFGINCEDNVSPGTCGTLYAINKEDGSLKWSYDAFNGDIRVAPGIGKDAIYVRNATTAEIYAFEKDYTQDEEVAPLWTKSLMGADKAWVAESNVVIVEDSSGTETLWVLGEDDILYSLKAETGEVLDSYTLSGTSGVANCYRDCPGVAAAEGVILSQSYFAGSSIFVLR